MCKNGAPSLRARPYVRVLALKPSYRPLYARRMHPLGTRVTAWAHATDQTLLGLTPKGAERCPGAWLRVPPGVQQARLRHALWEVKEQQGPPPDSITDLSVAHLWVLVRCPEERRQLRACMGMQGVEHTPTAEEYMQQLTSMSAAVGLEPPSPRAAAAAKCGSPYVMCVAANLPTSRTRNSYQNQMLALCNSCFILKVGHVCGRPTSEQLEAMVVADDVAWRAVDAYAFKPTTLSRLAGHRAHFSGQYLVLGGVPASECARVESRWAPTLTAADVREWLGVYPEGSRGRELMQMVAETVELPAQPATSQQMALRLVYELYACDGGGVLTAGDPRLEAWLAGVEIFHCISLRVSGTRLVIKLEADSADAMDRAIAWLSNVPMDDNLELHAMVAYPDTHGLFEYCGVCASVRTALVAPQFVPGSLVVVSPTLKRLAPRIMDPSRTLRFLYDSGASAVSGGVDFHGLAAALGCHAGVEVDSCASLPGGALHLRLRVSSREAVWIVVMHTCDKAVGLLMVVWGELDGMHTLVRDMTDLTGPGMMCVVSNM